MMESGLEQRSVVMISGAPGVGKTTIARPLARALGLPLFAKDAMKERLHDLLVGAEPADQAWSRRLGAATMELLWLLAADAPGCVLEANFWNGQEQQNAALRKLSESSTLIELYCTAPRAEILRRFQARTAAGERHPVHPDQVFTPEHWEQNFAEPIGIGKVVEVDTSAPVDVAALAATVRALLPG